MLLLLESDYIQFRFIFLSSGVASSGLNLNKIKNIPIGKMKYVPITDEYVLDCTYCHREMKCKRKDLLWIYRPGKIGNTSVILDFINTSWELSTRCAHCNVLFSIDYFGLPVPLIKQLLQTNKYFVECGNCSSHISIFKLKRSEQTWIECIIDGPNYTYKCNCGESVSIAEKELPIFS